MNRLVMWVLLGVVATAAAVLSFTALRDLALAVGFTGALAGAELAWLLPVTVDAGAAAGCLVWLGRIEGTTDEARRFARTLTWVLLFGSVAGNAVQHGLAAYGLVPPWWLVVVVSAVPPAVLGAVVHLAVQITTPVEAAGDEGGEQVAEAGEDDQEGGDPLAKVRELLASGSGRGTVAKELGVTPSQARTLIDQARQGVAA